MNTINKMNRSERMMRRNERDKNKTPNEKPVIRLRSMTTLMDKNKQINVSGGTAERKGQLLKTALKNNLKRFGQKEPDRPIVDVFESLVNRKVTYAPKHNDNKKCNADTDVCLCEDCDLESPFLLPIARFGKVYPSPNEKLHPTANKNNNSLKYSNMHENYSSDDKKISLPPEKKSTNIKRSLYSESGGNPNNVSSIFGKVYVKKSCNDLSFLKRDFPECNKVESECASSDKRKRSE